jgi:hypothetical protein
MLAISIARLPLGRKEAAMPPIHAPGTRLLAALSGVVGVITLTAHFLIPPGQPPDTSTLAQLAAFATRNHDAILVSAWLQTTGAVLIALFAVAIVHLAGAQARLSGWVTLLAATIVVVLSLLDSAFIIAAVSAPSSHPATATVSYDLIVGPANDAVGRTFLLTLPLILPLGVVLLGATPPILPRWFGQVAIGLGAAFLVLGLVNLFSRTAFALALVLIIVQNLWIVAAAVTMAAGQRPTTQPAGQAA